MVRLRPRRDIDPPTVTACRPTPFVRPFPTQECAELLSRLKAVGVVETSTSYGSSMRGGNLLAEPRASLYDCPKRPLTTSFMAGLGGDVIPPHEFYWMAEVLTKALKAGKVGKKVYWSGSRSSRPDGPPCGEPKRT